MDFRDFFRKKKLVLLTFGGGLMSLGLLSGLYAIRQTVCKIDKIVDSKPASLRREPQYIYLNKSLGHLRFHDNYRWETAEWEDRRPFLKEWIVRRLKSLSWRLLEIVESGSAREQSTAIRVLKSLPYLDDSDYQHLAQRCDHKSAVMLAREPEISSKCFLSPPVRKECHDKSLLLGRFQELLHTLEKTHKHWCLEYFNSKMFWKSRLKHWGLDYEYLPLESGLVVKMTEDDAITLCVESLLHHMITVQSSLKTMIEARGLDFLLDACRSMTESYEIKALSAKILVRVCAAQEYSRDIHMTGWLKVLVEWSRQEDSKLSCIAASALANLEGVLNVKNEVCLLHPVCREVTSPKVDVVVIHGLLGSVHSTWRQRDWDPTILPLIDIVAGDGDDDIAIKSYCSLNNVINDMPCVPENLDENVGDDFEFVLSDIPVSESRESLDNVYSVPGTDERVQKCQNFGCSGKSKCWPKDWLPKDFKQLRILGVDYQSRITEWTDWCPFRDKKEALLSTRAKTVLEELTGCGVGDRPIVWIGHSMGGLIIKHILSLAMDDHPNHQNLLSNTKSVIFLGTPHYGSPITSLRLFLAPLLPSVETKELELNSPDLLNLHSRFSHIVDNYGIEVSTFIETRGAKLTVPFWELELNCVAPMLSDTGTGVIYQIPVGHIDLAKLNSPLSFLYIKILDNIERAGGLVKNNYPNWLDDCTQMLSQLIN